MHEKLSLKISRTDFIVVPLCTFCDSNDYQCYHDRQLTTKELKIGKIVMQFITKVEDKLAPEILASTIPVLHRSSVQHR